MANEKRQQSEKNNKYVKKQIKKAQKKIVVKNKQTSLKRSKLNIDLINQKKHKTKSISVLIVNVLLIVVALVIVLVILNFGSIFTKGKLSSLSDVVKDYKKSDVDFFLNVEPLKNNSIQIKNSSKENLNITGYSIISKMNASLLNRYIFFDENEQKNLISGGITTIPIACYPEREFNLEIFFEDETKAVKKITTNDYDFGRCLLPLYLEPFKREIYNVSLEEYCGDECDLELIEVKQLHNHGHWETRIFNIDDHDYFLQGMPYLPFGLVFYNKKLRHSTRVGTADLHLISPQNLNIAPQLYELIFEITSFNETYTVSSFLEVEYDYCFPSGNGSEEDPYIICSVGGLEYIKNNLSAHYALGADIFLTSDDMGNRYYWTPIGTQQNPFTGSFDGRNHAIVNLSVYKPLEDYLGLFGYVGSYDNIVTIKNLRLRNVDIYGRSSVGSIVGCGYVNLENSSADGDIYISGHGAGGLMGYNFIGSIKSSYSKVNVISNDVLSGEIGGLVGGFGEECPAEESCYISNSYSVGLVNPVNQGTGGLVGWLFNGQVTNCFYDSQNSGQVDTGKGIPKTTVEMNTRSTFENAGWDFTDLWAIDSRFNWGYPYHIDNRPR